MQQLTLDLDFYPVPDWDKCKHSGFDTMACRPSGFFCDKCKTLISQMYIPPDQPERDGYVGASWAAHYRDGEPWTTIDKSQYNAIVNLLET